jgi:hypothetical protein
MMAQFDRNPRSCLRVAGLNPKWEIPAFDGRYVVGTKPLAEAAD